MIVEILIFVLTSVIGYYIYTHKRIHQKFERYGLKYNPGIPIFGNTIRSTFLRRHMIEDVEAVYKEFPDEKYVGYIEGTKPVILIRDPDIIKNITVKDFDHFVNHMAFFPVDAEPLYKSGLIMMKDDKWRDMRTTLSPAFTGSKMRLMMPFMFQISENIVEYLKDHLSEDIDVTDLMRRYTNDVIASSAFGFQVNSVKDKENEFYKTGQALFNKTTVQKFKFFLGSNYPAIVRLLGIEVIPEHVKMFFNNIVTTTIDYREKNNFERPDMIQLLVQASKGKLKVEEADRKDDVLIQAEKLKKHGAVRQWSLPELASQVFTFFFAGFDTSATALVMCTHELAVNPDVQDRLYKEIKQFKEKNEKLTYENINELKYLECVLNETLRKWAPGLVMDRVVSKAYELPPPHDGGKPYMLNPGDIVYNVVNPIHMDPKHFPEPEVFNPDRFSDENKPEIKPFTYMPFGVGPRNCLGSRFALLELKILMYHLILNFKILKCKKTTDPIVLMPHDFNIRALGGTWVKVEKRN